MQDALGLTSDQVYRWRLLLEEYSPTIEYIKEIHSTVADAISQLDHGPFLNDRYNWMTFTQCWCHYTETAQETCASQANYTESINLAFANRSKENSNYPLTTRERAESHSKGTQLVALTTQDGYSTRLVENIKVLCKDGKLVIPKNLQYQVVAWYHHYLQHPGSTCLKETLFSAMYWKGMQHTM